ncbi:MAG: hypothetical protein GYB68_12805, partial [Chloroflexi bacterium]|nr:hypothetical protein [Chloroflexota bacterium]
MFKKLAQLSFILVAAFTLSAFALTQQAVASVGVASDLAYGDFEGMDYGSLPANPGNGAQANTWYTASGSPQVFQDPADLIPDGDAAVLLQSGGVMGIFQDQSVEGLSGDEWEVDFSFAYQSAPAGTRLGAQIEFRDGEDISGTTTCLMNISGTSSGWSDWSANFSRCLATASASYSTVRVSIGWLNSGSTGFGGLDAIRLTLTQEGEGGGGTEEPTGDICLSAEEAELVSLINAYRADNGLPAAPVSLSLVQV